MGSSVSKVPEERSSVPPQPSEPWRYKDVAKTLFTVENEENLKKSCSQLDIPNIERANFLVLGPVSAGKSSVINSLATIDNGRYSEVRPAAFGGKSHSFKFAKYTPREIFKNFNICDTMGFQSTDSGFNVKDIMHLVNGHITKGYPFNPASPITEENKYFNKNPTACDKVHCIVYVIDAVSITHTVTPTEILKITGAIQERLKEKEIPRVVILTKIDKLCEKVHKDVAKTFESPEVNDAVTKASEMFRIPRANVFPVQNYEESPEVCFKLNILILLALKHMLGLVIDYLRQMSDDVEEEEGEGVSSE